MPFRAGMTTVLFLPSPPKHLQTKNLFWFDRRLQRMGSDPAITQRLLQELEQELMRVDQPLIIAMHFVPHSQFPLRHPFILNALMLF